MNNPPPTVAMVILGIAGRRDRRNVSIAIGEAMRSVSYANAQGSHRSGSAPRGQSWSRGALIRLESKRIRWET